VIHAMALWIAICTDPLNLEEREKQLESVMKKYGDSELKKLMAIFKTMFNDYKDNFGDHLGKIYMQLVPKSANSQGQVFTPYHVAKLMCELAFDKDEFGKKIIKINDPCCGAGVFSIAYCDLLNDHKINYLTQAIFYAEDIDQTCVEMCYLQLSFIGASAIIEHKNTLTQEKWNEYRTGGYILAHTNWIEHLGGSK